MVLTGLANGPSLGERRPLCESAAVVLISSRGALLWAWAGQRLGRSNRGVVRADASYVSVATMPDLVSRSTMVKVPFVP